MASFTRKLFTIISIVAAVYTSVEIFMQFLNTSICVTEGCKLVSAHTRFGDISILIIGLGIFVLLAILSIMENRSMNSTLRNVINILLISALSAEGFFTGYQAFHIKTLCLFCLSIFGIVLLLSIIRFLSGEKILSAGFVSFITVFGFLYLVLPAGITEKLPQEANLILFYSNDCRHCIEIKNRIDEAGIKVELLKASEYGAFLKTAGIEHVPTLLINEPYQKVFLIGKESIERFLFKKDNKTDKTLKRKNLHIKEELDIFTPTERIFMTPDEVGACKEGQQTEECE